MNNKETIKKIRQDLANKEYKKAKDGCKRVLLFEGTNHQVWLYLGLAQFHLNEYQDSEMAYLKALGLKPDLPVVYQGLIQLYEKQQDSEKLIIEYEKARQCYFRNELYLKYFEITQNLIQYYENLTGHEEKILELTKDLLPGSPHYREEYYVDQSKLLFQYYKIESILCSQKELLIEKLIESKRRSLSEDSMTTIKFKVRTEVYEDKKYLNCLLDIIQLMGAINMDIKSEEYIQYSKKYLQHLYYLVGSTFIKGKKNLLFDLQSYAQYLIEHQMESKVTYQVLISFGNVYHPELYNNDQLEKYIKLEEDNNCLFKRIALLVKNHHVDFDQFKELNEEIDFKELIEEAEESKQLFTMHSILWLLFNFKYYDLALKVAKSLLTHIEHLFKGELELIQNVYDSCKLNISNCYLKSDNLSFHNQAYQLLQIIVNNNNNNLYAFESLLEYGLMKKNYSLLLEWINNNEINNNNFNILSIKGWSLIKLNKIEEGKEILLKVIQNQPNDYKTYYRLGVIYWENKEYELSYDYFIKSLKNNNEFGEVLEYLGYYYQQIKLNHNKALKCFINAIKYQPKLENCYKLIYQIQTDKEEWEFIEQLLNQMIYYLPNSSWVWEKKGYLDMSKNDSNNAIISFQKSLKLNSDNLMVWKGLGLAYYKEGRYKASLKCFLKQNKEDIISFYYLAKVYLKLNQFKEAINLLIELNNKKTNYLPIILLLSEAYLNFANQCFKSGDFGYAASILNDSLKNLLNGIQVDKNSFMCWELIGETLYFLRLLLNQLNSIDINLLNQLIKELNSNLNEKDKIQLINNDNNNNNNNSIQLNKILLLSILSYKIILIINKSPVINILYKIARNYFILNKINNSNNNNLQQQQFYYKLSFNYLLRCIQLNPSYSKAWNLLGVLNLKLNPKLAQHAFIQASILENHKNSSSLTNYGYLCLLQGDNELSEQLINKSMDIQPDSISNLIGKLILMNELKLKESNEMIIHINELNQFNCINLYYEYSNLMFQFKKYDLGQLSIMKYLEINQLDPKAFNLMGLYYERFQFFKEAIECFKNSKQLLEEKKEKEKENNNRFYILVILNYARVLCSNKNYIESINQFQCLLNKYNNQLTEEQKIQINIGLGLAYYFNNSLQESFDCFEATLNHLDYQLYSTILMSKLLYQLNSEQHLNMAQQLLLNSIENQFYTIETLCILYSLSTFTNELELKQAAIDELLNVPKNTKAKQDPLNFSNLLLSINDYVMNHSHTQLINSLNSYPDSINLRLIFILIQLNQLINLNKKELLALIRFINSTLSLNLKDAKLTATLYFGLSKVQHILKLEEADMSNQKAKFAAPWLLQ